MASGPVTALTVEEFTRYADEAIRLLKALPPGAPPLSIGLLGVSLIQQCIRQTDGDPEWWASFVRNGTLPAGTMKSPVSE